MSEKSLIKQKTEISNRSVKNNSCDRVVDIIENGDEVVKSNFNNMTKEYSGKYANYLFE